MCGSVDKGKGKMARSKGEEMNERAAIRRTEEGRRKQGEEEGDL
jgi:hypothetical protein